jgi:hypothetical protein
VQIVLKSGSLSLLEPSGPVKACNGIALSLPLLKRAVCLLCIYLQKVKYDPNYCSTVHSTGLLSTINNFSKPKIGHLFSGKGRAILGTHFLSELAVTVMFKFHTL